MKICIRLSSLIILLCLPFYSFAADRLEIYPLKQRSAEEIIPVIKPLLPANSAINGNGYKLLVRGDENTHQLVKQAIAQLDAAAQDLIISVRFSSPSTHTQQQRSVEVQAQSGDVSVHSGQSPRTGSPGGQATLGSDNNRVTISGRSLSTKRDNDAQYRLRVLAGNTAFIQTGSAIPYGNTTVHPNGLVQSGIEFRQTRNGFLVRPRLNNDRVFLDINPGQENESPQGGGRIDSQQIQTTVSGRLGEWIELGGVSSSRQQANSGTLYSTRQGRNLSDRVYLKVELANK